jgi:hypothetical protein
MAASGPRVMFLSQMGAPGSYDPAIFAEAPGGDDEGHWIRLRFQELGLLDAMQYSARRVCQPFRLRLLRSLLTASIIARDTTVCRSTRVRSVSSRRRSCAASLP